MRGSRGDRPGHRRHARRGRGARACGVQIRISDSDLLPCVRRLPVHSQTCPAACACGGCRRRLGRTSQSAAPACARRCLPSAAHAQVFNPETEVVYQYLQVFSASAVSFAHGANDVANAVGPFAGIWWASCTRTAQLDLQAPRHALCACCCLTTRALADARLCLAPTQVRVPQLDRVLKRRLACVDHGHRWLLLARAPLTHAWQRA